MRKYRKGLIFAGFVGLSVVAYVTLGDQLSLRAMAERETALLAFRAQHPLLVYALAFGIYVLVTGLSLPGAAAMSLVIGWYFGFWRGLVLISFASTTGATIAFLLSRYLMRDAIQRRFGQRLEAFNRALEREGAFYLFTLRLIPAVPFFVINVVMGITPIPVRTFWWVSQLGMLPGTCVYVFAGSKIPGLSELAERGTSSLLDPLLIGAFVVLGVFPLAIKKTVEYFRGRLPTTAVSPEPTEPIEPSD